MNNIAIYGFGRIGRSTLKGALRTNRFVPGVMAKVKDIEMGYSQRLAEMAVLLNQ